MTSSVYGITVTVLAMYIFLGTSVTFCRMRKNFAHVFGKRNEGLLQDSVDNVFDKRTSDPLIDRIRSYVFSDLKENQDDFADSLLKDSLYDRDIDVATTPQVLESYGHELRDRMSLLDLMSPVEKEYLSYLYDLDAEDKPRDRFPKYI